MRFSKFPKILILLIFVPVYIFFTYMYPHQERKSFQKGKLENVNWRKKTNLETDFLYKPINDEEIDERQFETWLQNKEDLNKNIQKVCVKYGKTLKHIGAIKSAGTMYDAEHNLLFTHNAKVGTTSWMINFFLISTKYRHLLSKVKNKKGSFIRRKILELFNVKFQKETASDEIR